MSPVCIQIHDKIPPRFLAKGYRSYTFNMMQCGQLGAAQGTLPAAAVDLGSCGKRIDIPFLKTGIVKHRVVLLEPEGQCPGAAFWWKQPVTALNLE